jgi:hypothetical protein
MRIRIVGPPDPDAFAEYDVQRFRVGDIYEVPVRLASLLIIAGYAKSVSSGVSAAEAADFSSPRTPRSKKS